MYKNMYGFLPPAPPCAHDSMVDTRDDYSALFISTQNCVLCSSLALHVLNQGWSWLWLPFPTSFSSSSLSSLFSRYTFSINNLHLHLYFAVSLGLLLSYSHFFISHTFHRTGRLILTYSKNSLYVRVAGNIQCILTQGAIQFCSSKLFSCFVQPSVSTA